MFNYKTSSDKLTSAKYSHIRTSSRSRTQFFDLSCCKIVLCHKELSIIPVLTYANQQASCNFSLSPS